MLDGPGASRHGRREGGAERGMGETTAYHRRGVALIAASAVVWSLAGLFMRLIALDLWIVQFWRAAFGAAALYLFLALQHRGGFARALRLPASGLGAVAISATAMIAYISSLHLTTVAEVMIVVATMPIVAAFLAWAWIGERPGGRVLATSLVALAGIAVMVGGAPGVQSLVGDGFAFVMTVLFAALIVMARRDHGLDMTVVNAHAALIVAVLALPLAGAPAFAIGARELTLLALFGASTTALAFALFLYGARHVPPAEAALIVMLDNVLSPVWVWLAFGETPGRAAILGGAIVLAAVLFHLAADLAAARRRGAPPRETS